MISFNKVCFFDIQVMEMVWWEKKSTECYYYKERGSLYLSQISRVVFCSLRMRATLPKKSPHMGTMSLDSLCVSENSRAFILETYLMSFIILIHEEKESKKKGGWIRVVKKGKTNGHPFSSQSWPEPFQ